LNPDDVVDFQQDSTARAAEIEIDSFIEGIGPTGVAEVSLYRMKPNGRQIFIVTGPPGQFSEMYVQNTYGGGDYLVRGKIDGKWFRSRTFSVEGPPVSTSPAHASNADTEIERLKLQIQQQQMTMEQDRAASMQRNHELQLALIQNLQHTNGGGNTHNMSIADMVAAVKNLNDLGGQDAIDKAIDRVFNLASKVQQLTNPQAAGGADEGWWGWAKPVVQEAGKQLLPRVLPFLNAPAQAQPAAPPAPPPAVVPQGALAAAPPMADTVADAANGVRPPQEPSMTEEQVYIGQKKEALAFALMMARANRQPEVWADMAIEQIETANNPVTARFISEIVNAEKFDVWFAELEKLDPTVISQRPWFEAFFQCIKDTLAAKETEEDK
jgi:hypothetical protein